MKDYFVGFTDYTELVHTFQRVETELIDEKKSWFGPVDDDDIGKLRSMGAEIVIFHELAFINKEHLSLVEKLREELIRSIKL